MSTWTTPATWPTVTPTAVTGAQMNTEIRDHLNYLKGALNLLTNSSVADTGTATYLQITRALTTEAAIRGLVAGDTNPRTELGAGGILSFGSGAAAVDTAIRRSGVGVLRASDTSLGADRASAVSVALHALVVGDSVNRLAILASGAHQWSTGAATADLQLSRGAAGQALLDANGASNSTVLRIQSTAGQTNALEVLVVGDVAVRGKLSGDATNTGLFLGPGSSAALKVVGVRKTGWTIMTGTPLRGTFATSTITTAQLAGLFMALQQDVGVGGHGLIDA